MASTAAATLSTSISTGRRRRRRQGEDEHETAQHGQHLLGLRGQERVGPPGGGGDEVDPNGDRGLVVGGLEGEVVACAGEGCGGGLRGCVCEVCMFG